MPARASGQVRSGYYQRIEFLRWKQRLYDENGIHWDLPTVPHSVVRLWETCRISSTLVVVCCCPPYSRSSDWVLKRSKISVTEERTRCDFSPFSAVLSSSNKCSVCLCESFVAGVNERIRHHWSGFGVSCVIPLPVLATEVMEKLGINSPPVWWLYPWRKTVTTLAVSTYPLDSARMLIWHIL